MNGRGFAGLPISMWAIGIIGGIVGFVWLRQRGKSSSSSPGTPAQPSFTQAQEIQDFQIFSALTSQTQASDLNFLSEVAGLFAGGSSPTSNTPGGSTVPSPPSNGSVPPAVEQQYQRGVTGQVGALDNFFLLNLANQAAGYDYYTSQGLQTTPLGVAPGEGGG